MKTQLRFFIAITVFLFYGAAWGQTTIHSEDFESDGNGTRYNVTGGFSDGSGDYFVRTDGGSGSPSGMPNYSSSNNSYFFAGEDTEDTGNPNSTTSDVTINNIEIQDYTNLTIKGLFACGGQAKFDPEDYMRIYIDIDNSGSWTLIGAFEADISSGYNSANFGLDADLNGQADGPTYLTSSFSEYSFNIANTGNLIDIKIELYLTSGDEEAAFDYIRLEGTSSSTGPDDPSSFSATASSTSQIDLSFSTNASGDNIVIVYDTDGTFSDPSGSPPALGESFAGGTLIYNGTGTSYAHGSLNANTQYYYKAWSFDNSDYSTGLEDNATTYKNEPTNHPGDFSAIANGHDQIDLSWTDATGAILPDGYLIKANTDGSFSDPSDGTDPIQDTDLSDGSALVKVAHGAKGGYSFTSLSAETEYFFKIWSYTNSGSQIDFKTDGTVPTASATTGKQPVNPTTGTLYFSEVSDASDYNNEYVELFNNSDDIIDLSNTKLIMQTDGTVWNIVDLTGDTEIPANGFFIISRGATLTNFENEWGELPSNCNFSEGTGGMYFGATARRWVLKDGGTAGNDDGTLIDDTEVTVAGSGNRSYQYPTDTWVTEAYFGNSTPGYLDVDENPATYLWDGGATTTNWNDANNWNPNQIPGPNTNVTITSAKADINISSSSTADCKNLTVESGASLTIQSDATGTGSLIIHGTATGDINMEIYIEGYGTTSTGWHLISPAVENVAVQGGFVPTTPDADEDLYFWDEATGYWINHKTDNGSWNTSFDDPFIEGKGYLYANKTDVTKTLTGVPNTGTFQTGSGEMPALTYGSTYYKGLNLIGNPFTSGIDWDELSKSNDVYGTVHVRNAQGQYDAWNGSTGDLTDGIIPQNNGFFVEVNSAGQTITIELEDQVHTNDFYKSSKSKVENLVVLGVSGNNLSDRIFIHLNDDATSGFDFQYDGRKFYGVAEAPQFMSVLEDGTELKINELPSSTQEIVIDLGLVVGVSGDYTIHPEEINTLPEVYLEDTFTGEMIDLIENDKYEFTSDINDPKKRFKLHLFKSTGINEAQNIEGLNIYTHNNILYLNSNRDLDAQVNIYNVTGQAVYAERAKLDGLVQINTQLPAGWYVVKVTTGEGMASEKVFIR